MNLADVMDQVADQLRTIDTLTGRTFAYPSGKVTPPAAVVQYPEEYTFDATYGRGMDRMTLPVVVVLGKVSDRAVRDHVVEYASGTGARSVKQVLESGTYTAFHTLRVIGVEFATLSIAGTDYLGLFFDLDITGQGG